MNTKDTTTLTIGEENISDYIISSARKQPEAQKDNTEMVFYSMRKYPKRETKYDRYSKTVLVFDSNQEIVELGYYDFYLKKWGHFGQTSLLLNCWSYVPDPSGFLEGKSWKPVKHLGYSDRIFSAGGSTNSTNVLCENCKVALKNGLRYK